MSDIDSFHRKFLSSNDIPVSQAVIKREEYEVVAKKIAKLESAYNDACVQIRELTQRNHILADCMLEVLAYSQGVGEKTIHEICEYYIEQIKEKDDE